MLIEQILKNDKVLKVIEYGSKVYGTNNENSDTDYIIVLDDTKLFDEWKYEKEDFQLIAIDMWDKRRTDNDIRYIEAYFSDDKHWLKGNKDKFEIDYDKVRAEFARIASNSWVKCKKKLIIEDSYNPYIAKKSLFHSLRILMFGIQIMKLGKIVDFSEANIYYKEIMDSPNDWEYLKEKYQPIYNKLKSEFRLEHSKLK